MKTSWRRFADWGKRRDAMLWVADKLGRGRGGMRFLDELGKPPAPDKPDLAGWEDRTLSAVWIGHATVLLRIGGMTILTDPVFSNRIGLGAFLATVGPMRHVMPALRISQLPKIDLILMSHAHFDHLDRPTLARLSRTVPVLTAHRTGDLIRDLGFRATTELRWGESATFGPLTIRALPVVHWGARTFLDKYRGFNGYLLQADAKRVLYGGDTAYHDGFAQLGRVDLGIFGIGAYDPYIAAHATPEQAWQMADQVRADFVLPMHHGTFRLSHEPMHEPIERILAAAGNDAGRIVIRKVGQSWSAGT